MGKCASNIRQIGLGIEMYANDFGGALPPDAATILITQDLTTEALICPSSNDQRAVGATPADLARSLRTPGRCSYVYVAAPLKRRAAVTPAHVLAYENLQNHPADVHVLFGDGRAKSFPKAEAARLIAELQAGHNPPRPRK